jgi:hypothetical protein
MRTRSFLTVIGLMLSLVGVGCANSGSSSDHDNRGVFYGGVTGGGTWP